MKESSLSRSSLSFTESIDSMRLTREMPADIAQEFDVVQRGQPFSVIRHQGLAGAEIEELRKGLADLVLVGVDLFDGQDLARLITAGRIADPGGAAAHQRDGPVAGALQPGQHHDRDQMADMK